MIPSGVDPVERDRETARALEIVLSRVRLDGATAHVLRGNLANVQARIEADGSPRSGEPSDPIA